MRRVERKAAISIIGAGRLGTALGLALSSIGYSIEAVMARRINHARRSAKLIGPNTLALNSEQLELLPTSSILFITTPDDEIESVAKALAAALPKEKRGARTALHASGALSSKILQPLRAVGFRTASMHPLVAVSDSVSGAESFRNAYFCLEGEPRAVQVARSLVSDLGAKSFSIAARDKALYHAAAVVASGHTVALFDISTEMLEACGLNEREARAVLLPLVRSTLDNLARREPARALTGTFARADATTVRKHLAALRALQSSAPLAAYLLLGQRSLQLAKERGADADDLREIKSLLEEGR